MGRWDKFSKDSKIKTELSPTDIQQLRDHCQDMTESEKDVVVGRIIETYNYIGEITKSEDTSPVDHSKVEAMITMLYGAYNELSSPPSILVVACQIAKKDGFSPSTVKLMLKCVYKMLEGRFGAPGKHDFKFE
jgi:hypothetical protein